MRYGLCHSMNLGNELKKSRVAHLHSTIKDTMPTYLSAYAGQVKFTSDLSLSSVTVCSG